MELNLEEIQARLSAVKKLINPDDTIRGGLPRMKFFGDGSGQFEVVYVPENKYGTMFGPYSRTISEALAKFEQSINESLKGS